VHHHSSGPKTQARGFSGAEPPSRSWLVFTLTVGIGLLGSRAAAAEPPQASADESDRATVAAPSGRRIPDSLNFANGLFRDRRYDLAAQEYERFLKDAKPGPDFAEGRFGLANARLFQGEYERARRDFEAFLRESPGHVNAGTAWYRVGETAYMLGDLPSARKAFERFTTDYPNHKHLDTAWPYLGDVCLRMGDLERAQQSYQRSLDSHPEGRLADRARFGLGRALALQGRPDEALGMFAALAEKGGQDWADRAWFQSGLAEVQAKRYERAIDAFERVERVAPQSPLVAEARLNRAEALGRLDRGMEAEPILRALVADAPRNLAAQAAFALGSSQLERGDAATAFATLEDAAGRFAKTPMASALLFRLAEAASKLGRGEDARTLFMRAAEADVKDPWADDALVRAARLAMDQNDHETATRLSRVFLVRYPSSPLRADARLVAARASLKAGRPKEAIATLTSSLADDKPNPATAEAERYYLARALQADGQMARADEVLDALSKASGAPIAADALFLLGQGQIEAKRFAEAIAPLEKYLAGKPNGEVAEYALAHLIQAHLELGRADAAWKTLEILAERFPKSPVLAPSRVRLAESAMAAKQYDRAAEQFALAAKSSDSALSGRARLGLGWAKLDGGKPNEAAAAFAAFLSARSDDPLAPEAAFARGRALEASAQVDAALAAYTLCAENYPEAEQAALAAIARARLLDAAKRPIDAAESYRLFFERHPNYKPASKDAPALDELLSEWGWVLLDADRPADSDKVFARLLAEFPESPLVDDARFNLAESAHQANKPEEVERLLLPLVADGARTSPRLLQVSLYRLGRTRADRKEWVAAAQALDRLLTEFPQTPLRREARRLRAQASLETGDAARAEAEFAALAAGPPDPSDPKGFAFAVHRGRVQSLLALKRWNEVIDAAKALKAEFTAESLISEVDYARGRALQQLARWDEARSVFQAVIDARKGGDLVARAQLMIGETYFHQKDYHEAIRQFLMVDILYDAPPWQAAALLETGKVYEQLTQWADAAEIYEKLCAKFSSDPAAAEAKNRLEAVKKNLQSKPANRPAQDSGDERL
jgi:TolA-binding protein